MGLNTSALQVVLDETVVTNHLDHLAEADTGKVALAADQAVDVTKVGGDAISGLSDIVGISVMPQGD